jgi:hypothetical protein
VPAPNGTGPIVAFFGLAYAISWASWLPIALDGGTVERGYALPRLQARLGPLRATFVLATLWACWHAPLFVTLDSYGDLSPFILLGFFIGPAAGALVQRERAGLPALGGAR